MTLYPQDSKSDKQKKECKKNAKRVYLDELVEEEASFKSLEENPDARVSKEEDNFEMKCDADGNSINRLT